MHFWDDLLLEEPAGTPHAGPPGPGCRQVKAVRMLCQFPDGSVIVSDLLKTHEKDGVVSEGAWRRVDVVVLTLSVRMQSLTDALVKDQSGQDLIEYALVVALIALAATAGMGVVASSIKTAFNHIGSHLSSYTT